MYSIVSTAIVHGIDSIPVQVEADVSNGMPYFEMVGFLGAEVKESKERVRTAKCRISTAGKAYHGKSFAGGRPEIRISL